VIYSYNKINEMHYFLIFWNKTLHVSESFSVHHQELIALYTQQCYMSYRFGDSLRVSIAVSITSMTYTIAVCTVLNS